MAYIAPIHRPSSIRQALHIRLLSPDEESIVIAKANRIELWRFNETDHLTLFHAQAVFGTISMMQKLRPKDAETDILFVGTDRFEFFTFAWDASRQVLQTIDAFQDGGEKPLRDCQSRDQCLVDPSGRFMALHLWEGVLSLLRLRPRRDHARTLKWMDQARLAELFIRASAFLYSETGHPRIAFLYKPREENSTEDNTSPTKLASYRFTADDRNEQAARFDATKDRELDMDIDDPHATILIPVERVEDETKRHHFRNTASAKAYLGGLIVVGGTQLSYIDDTTRSMVEVPLKQASLFLAWARYDATHYFLADEYGVLHLLTIHVEGGGSTEVTKLSLHPIGKTSRASCLVYVDTHRTLFVGSHSGDAQLFRIDVASEDGHFCELLQVLPNIGPILDFAVMDMGHREDDRQLANEYASGQARLVTGSGYHQDGTLRSVRSGVGLEDVGILGDLPHVRRLFSLRSPACSLVDQNQVDTLVVSFPTETRVFLFDSEGAIEEVESYQGLSLSEESLWVSTIGEDRHHMLQVTSSTVTLGDTESGVIVASWSPETGKTITGVSANRRWVFLSIDGRQLVSLDLKDNSLRVAAQKNAEETDQIACVHASPSGTALENVGVVGLWSSGSLSLVDLATLEPHHERQSLRRSGDTASIPRHIALVQVLPPAVAGPTLLVAMDDGNVITFSVSSSDLTLSGRKSVILGTRQARFHLLPNAHNETYNIFVTTDHPSLIYGSSEGRIVYAAVTAEDANAVCPFSTEAFASSDNDTGGGHVIAVATDTELKLSRVDTQRQTHVRTIAMGETVRRIAYAPKEQVFALACIQRELTHNREVAVCSVQLVDEVLFQPVGNDPFLLEQDGGELVESLVRMDLADGTERFLVGTSLTEPSATMAETTKGRLLVLGIDSHRNLYQVSAHELRGPCRSLAILEDDDENPLIVAGLGKTVVVYRYVETVVSAASGGGQLHRIAAYRTATYIVTLAVHGHTIAVGDMMKSVVLVEFVPAKPPVEEDVSENIQARPGEPAELVERGRDYRQGWTTAVALIGDSDKNSNACLAADGFGNLLVLEQNTKGVTADDKRRLQSSCEMNLGEMVNRIQPIAVETSPGALVHPKAFLATVEGSIYMFGTVAAASQDMLMNLQTKLASKIKGPGNIQFLSYRGFRNGEREDAEPFRFLDGELLERFLDFDETTQQEIAQGLGPSVEDLRNIVEELKRLH